MTEFLLYEALLELHELEEIHDSLKANRPRSIIPPDVQKRMDAFKRFEVD